MVRVLDIFSGVGGSSYGAKAAGCSIVAAIDLCELATKTFKDNFSESLTFCRKLEHTVLRKLRAEIGEIDLLLASPECTNHTCAKGSAPRSEESRATALQVVRFARAFQPRWIVLENVIHMRPWSRYPELKAKLRNLGYKLNELVLDASNFSVAQKRRRLFLLADRDRQPPDVASPADAPVLTVQSILDPPGVWKTSPLERYGRAPDTIARARRAIAELGDSESFLVVYYGSDGCGGWQPLDRPLRTVTTIDRFALVTPGPNGHEMRMLQVSELQRAMGFQEDFRLSYGTRRDKIRLLGNAVCPPVMQTVVSALMAE